MNDLSTHLPGAAPLRQDSTQPPSAIQDTESATRGFALLDANLRIIAADAAVRGWLNRISPASAPAGSTLEVLLDAAPLPENALRTLDRGDFSYFPARLRGTDGDLAQVQVAIRRLDGAGEPLLLATIDDAPPPGPTAHDALTHLPDRRELHRRVAQWRRASADAPARFAVLFLDLDDFKAVNDRFGHAVGDAVLRQVAARWARCVREEDLVCRYGGDEFVLLIHNVATSRDVAPVVARLAEATASPVNVGGVEHKLRATIGAALATSGGESLDELIAAADHDMYAHKPRVLR